jgi:hypothetical protein
MQMVIRRTQGKEEDQIFQSCPNTHRMPQVSRRRYLPRRRHSFCIKRYPLRTAQLRTTIFFQIRRRALRWRYHAIGLYPVYTLYMLPPGRVQGGREVTDKDPKLRTRDLATKARNEEGRAVGILHGRQEDRECRTAAGALLTSGQTSSNLLRLSTEPA